MIIVAYNKIYLTYLYSCLFLTNYASFLNIGTPPNIIGVYWDSRATIYLIGFDREDIRELA